VFVELYGPVNKERKGVADETYRMTVVQPIPKFLYQNKLRGWKMYPLTIIYYSVHLVPVDERYPNGNIYINNTADFETYNFV
jgi:hypothetical protein